MSRLRLVRNTVFCLARQFWYSILCQVGFQHLAPQPAETSFDDWWDKAWQTTPDHLKKGFNTLVALGAWILWTHRNACLFDGAAPSMARALDTAGDERRLWEIAGARGLTSLTAPALGA